MIISAPIDIKLSVEIQNKLLIVHLVFSNTSTFDIDLDRWAIFASNRIYNKYFQIKDATGQDVKYIGMMASRVFKKEDFIEFKSGTTIKTSIALNSAYKLTKGSLYSIKYYTYHQTSSDDPNLMILESNTVDVYY
jgi:hypothetical protein